VSPPLSRIQRLVVDQLAMSKERDLLVSAGAGSGKTTILVASVIAALKAGVPLERILVVTFTEKAAAEMKNKIYRAMGSHEELAHLRLRLPQAWISTIHSFCMRLLRERFQKAGVDPRFRILSEEDAKLLLADATTRVFHDWYEKARKSPKDPFEHLVEMCGFGPDGENLRAVIRELLAYARTSEDPERFLGRHRELLRGAGNAWQNLPWKDDFAARSARAYRSAVGLLRALVAEVGDAPAWTDRLQKIESIDPGLLATPEGQRAALEQLAALGAIADASAFKVRLPSVPRGMGSRLADLRKATSEAFKDAWLIEMPADETRVLADERAAEWLGLPLVALAEDVARGYEEAKSRTGRLDFEDLQIKALRLIEETMGTASAIRFDRVFIDEFQDVNGLQHRILEQVSDPTRVFRVGDVKQSIYQFRLAEPGIIRGLGRDRPLVEENERTPEDSLEWNVLLPRNHRSLPPVLRVVNAIAGKLFFEEEIGTEYGKQALVPGPETPPEGPKVELLLVRDEGKAGAKRASDSKEEDEEADSESESEGPDAPGSPAPDPREAEWSAIAARIREVVRPGILVRDPEKRVDRQAVYSDIAILLRAHTRAPALARRLEEEGIPCSVSTGESFFEAAEVRDVTSLLSAIDNMLDDIALASALRSPAFGWLDAELLSVRLAYPRARHIAFGLACLADRASQDGRYARALLPEDDRFRATLCGEPAELPGIPPFTTVPEKARRALDRFLAWRDAAGSIELPDLVSRVLEESGLSRSAASLPGGLRRRANLRKFVGIARRYAKDSGHSLNRFMRWLDLLKEGGAKVFEAPVSSESLPAVRILSIHKAKGLEFPVVIVAEMGRKYRLDSRTSAIAPGRRYLGLRLLDSDSYILRRPIPLRLLLDAARSDALAEEKRVLYVAMTRARDLLILSGVMSGQTAVPETLRRAFREAVEAHDATGKAVIEALLSKKPFPLSWLVYALPPIPDSDGPVGDLPLEVHWIHPEARREIPPTMNRIREIEPLLLAHEPAKVPGGTDAAALEIIERCARRPALPSPGTLTFARGKIWATEFKSARDQMAFIRPDSATEESPDEPAVPLIAREEAAREGTLIHAALERLELAGISSENLEGRIADAAAAVGGLPGDATGMLAEGMSRLLALPAGRILASGAEIHREVAFSLRLPLLEITRWLPQLRAELLASDDWKDWVEEDGSGALRIRAEKPREAGEPWVLVQGRIDAVLHGPDGWTVLDWKSDRVFGAEAIDARVETYRGQMEIYRRAAQALFGSPAAAVIFFLRPGILREV
jgi:ATP-dependent helicase/nuclease subunit A